MPSNNSTTHLEVSDSLKTFMKSFIAKFLVAWCKSNKVSVAKKQKIEEKNSLKGLSQTFA